MSEMNLVEYVARRIRELRTQLGDTGMSQEALAKAAGVTTNTISRWETGTYRPAIEDLEKLARVLGVSVLEFFPRAEIRDEKEHRIDALLRTAKQLHPNDLEELQKYAEFRRARHLYTAKSAGRKRRTG